ncbi:glutamate racemase [compost metagenome]
MDATLAALNQAADKPQRVGIIATHGTLAAGWYQQKLSAQGVEVIEPTAQELADWFVPGCYAVKRGAREEGGALLVRQAQALFERGAQKLILACTEVPIGLDAINAPFQHLTFDPAQALAERCSQLWQGN